MITIKDFSQKAGFSIRMLRYLEELGLLVAKRDSNNYRVYSEAQVLEAMGIKRIDDFNQGDVAQLMGPHDLVIRSTFKYRDSGFDGEIVIPYAPIYTMSQLSNKT